MVYYGGLVMTMRERQCKVRFRLTSWQRLLYYRELVEDLRTDNMVLCVELEGNVPQEKTLGSIVEALGLHRLGGLALEDCDEPMLAEGASGDAISMVSLEDAGDVDVRAYVARVWAEETLYRFSLNGEPLCRVRIVNAIDRVFIFFCAHHVLGDVLVLSRLARTVVGLLNGRSLAFVMAYPPRVLDYADWVIWEDSLEGRRALSESEAYWQRWASIARDQFVLNPRRTVNAEIRRRTLKRGTWQYLGRCARDAGLSRLALIVVGFALTFRELLPSESRGPIVGMPMRSANHLGLGGSRNLFGVVPVSVDLSGGTRQAARLVTEQLRRAARYSLVTPESWAGVAPPEEASVELPTVRVLTVPRLPSVTSPKVGCRVYQPEVLGESSCPTLIVGVCSGTESQVYWSQDMVPMSGEGALDELLGSAFIDDI